MRYYVICLLCLLHFHVARGQGSGYISVTGHVLDAETREPLPFANVTYNQHLAGTTADINGRFELKMGREFKEIEISYVGYVRKKLAIQSTEASDLEILLQPDKRLLEEVTVFAGENPALRIIRNVIANRKSNDPERLESFTYRAYNKFYITVDVPRMDSLVTDLRNVDNLTEDEADRLDMFTFLESKHVMAMESVSERKFRQPSSSEEVVLATRVSGLKDPQFSMLATTMQSFSFYKSPLQLIGMEYMNPVSSVGLRQYFFHLQDTSYSGQDTVFIIAFRPARGSAPINKMSGQIYINSNGWAIQNVIAEPAERQPVHPILHQKYESFEGHWFPVQLNYELIFDDITPDIGGYEMKGIGRAFLSEIDINPNLDNEKFSGLDIVLDKTATQNLPLIEQYRLRYEDLKISNTYQFVDSISETYKIEQRMGALSQISEGMIRWKYVAFDLNRLLRFNRAESVRLGLGLFTSDKLSRKFAVGSWMGYGFRDQSLKYGFEGRWKPTVKTQVRGGYEFDLQETGGIRFPPKSPLSLTSSDIRKFFVNQFDEVRQYYLEVNHQIRPQLHVKLHASHQDRKIRGDYRFDQQRDIEPEGIQAFRATVFDLQINYAPGDKYIQTAYKRLLLETSYPDFQLSIKRGVSWLDGEVDFTRVDFRSQMRWTLPSTHYTFIEVLAGVVDRPVPASFLHYGMGNRYDLTGRSFGLLIADRASFETLYFNEVLMDMHVSVLIHQEIVKRLYTWGKSTPGIEITAKALWGRLSSPELHLGPSFFTPTDGFYEVGLMINKLYNTLGIGVYLRMGKYAFEQFEDNIAFRLTTRF